MVPSPTCPEAWLCLIEKWHPALHDPAVPAHALHFPETAGRQRRPPQQSHRTCDPLLLTSQLALLCLRSTTVWRPAAPPHVPLTAPVAIPTGVTVLLQEGTKAPSSAPVASTTEVASTPPGAHAVEVDAPAAVEEDVPAAEQNDEAVPGEIAVAAQAAENPTAAAVQGQVRLRPACPPGGGAGCGVGLPSVRPLQGSVTVDMWSCCLTPAGPGFPR